MVYEFRIFIVRLKFVLEMNFDLNSEVWNGIFVDIDELEGLV